MSVFDSARHLAIHRCAPFIELRLDTSSYRRCMGREAFAESEAAPTSSSSLRNHAWTRPQAGSRTVDNPIAPCRHSAATRRRSASDSAGRVLAPRSLPSRWSRTAAIAKESGTRAVVVPFRVGEDLAGIPSAATLSHTTALSSGGQTALTYDRPPLAVALARSPLPAPPCLQATGCPLLACREHVSP
jgi:hypothetical protein